MSTYMKKGSYCGLIYQLLKKIEFLDGGFINALFVCVRLRVSFYIHVCFRHIYICGPINTHIFVFIYVLDKYR